MKLTNEGKTLFQELCTMFTNKLGHAINKRKFGNNTVLVATRDEAGSIIKINLSLHKNNILEVKSTDNEVFLDTTSFFTKLTINRLNKILKLVYLHIFQKNNEWIIADGKGQMAAFKNAESINLSRPHGSALYEQR